ncbi:flagellar assembly protein FliW [Alkalibacter mobilis]|uniref:flagellar assembly protein FliW n=1 Tax=Alkalibacter mobilis TaxID=2787712 RepID=UPI00189CB947|nr:flagellar assembly protein FliW [Alkalibacter mobilis]MBF7096333.1 flagellar assembly protein FliW [Alkalibacter mobilis]
MKIKTKFLGEVDINDKHVITFPDGILGFEDSRKFALLNIPGNEEFKVLQDIDKDYVSFIVAEPWVFYKDYEIEIPDEELLKIEIREKEQLAVVGIVTLAGDFYKSTINLLAPIVMNTVSKLGKQQVLNDVLYSTKHPLFEKKEVDTGVDTKQKNQ